MWTFCLLNLESVIFFIHYFTVFACELFIIIIIISFMYGIYTYIPETNYMTLK